MPFHFCGHELLMLVGAVTCARIIVGNLITLTRLRRMTRATTDASDEVQR